MLGLIASLILHAAPKISLEPSPVLYEMRLSGQVGQISPGIGEKALFDFGKDVEPSLFLFGSALGLGTSHPGAAVSIAPGACYKPYGVCLDVGLDLGGTQGGFLNGFVWKKNLFLGASFTDTFLHMLMLK